MQNNQQSALLQQLSQQLQELQLSTKGQQQINNLDQNKEKLKDITNNNSDQQNQFKFVYSVPQIIDPEPISCIVEPSDDLGGIFLGNYEGASNLDLLKSNKIRAVLTASIETGVKYSEEVIHFHEIIQAHDKESYDIVQHFEKAYDFIDKTRKFTNVLVHCFAGVSRSASLVISYLMKKQNLSFESALWKCKQKRRQGRNS